jgi:hypothetical protein
VASTLVAAGCRNLGGGDLKDAVTPSIPEDRADPEWESLGTIPANEIMSSATAGRLVTIGTKDGVYLRRLDDPSGVWKKIYAPDDIPAGKQGYALDMAIAPKADAGRIILSVTCNGCATPPQPIRYSDDLGATWHKAGDEFSFVNDLGRVSTIPPARLVLEGGALFAATGPEDFALSTDLGEHWHYIMGEARFPVAVGATQFVPMAGEANTILFGVEHPLDVAWVGKFTYPTDGTSVTPNFGAFTPGPISRVLPKTNDASVLGNRRPNLVAKAPGANSLYYVGVEGGILRLDAATGAFTWLRKQQISGDATYEYINSIWFDPADAAHFVFGGFDKFAAVEERSFFTVFETFDGGATISPVSPPAALAKIGAGQFFGTSDRRAVLQSGGDLLLFVVTKNNAAGGAAAEHVEVFRRKQAGVPVL